MRVVFKYFLAFPVGDRNFGAKLLVRLCHLELSAG